MLHRVIFLVAAATAFASVADAQGRRVDVLATEYKFELPEVIPAGVTTFNFVSKGVELHHMQIVRLEQGKTFADFEAAIRNPGPPPTWVTFVGGPNGSVPDGQHKTTVTTSLSAGNYVLLCLIPSPDGKPHVAKGMYKPLKVTGVSTPSAPVGSPKVDAVMTLYDYNFDLDKPLTAGRRNILIRNTAEQFHEAFIAKLPPGATPKVFLDWIQGGMKGPPPVMPMGGIVGISKGQENLLTVDLEEGTYALYCFLPDAKDGKEHVQHGMFKQITVTK